MTSYFIDVVLIEGDDDGDNEIDMVFDIMKGDEVEEGEERASVGNGNVELGEGKKVTFLGRLSVDVVEVASVDGDDDGDGDNEFDMAFDNVTVDEVEEGEERASFGNGNVELGEGEKVTFLGRLSVDVVGDDDDDGDNEFVMAFDEVDEGEEREFVNETECCGKILDGWVRMGKVVSGRTFGSKV